MGMSSFAPTAVLASAMALTSFAAAAEEAPTTLLRSDGAAHEVEAPTKLLRSSGNTVQVSPGITMTDGGVKNPAGLMGVGHFIINKDGQVIRKHVVPGLDKK